MNEKDPKPSQSPPPAKQAETLEDAVYVSSLVEGNKALRGTNPLVTLSSSILIYAALAGGIWFLTTQTETGKKVVKKTMGIDLTEQDEDKIIDDELPPPPPPPPVPVAVPLREEIKDAPPPPPITDQEIIPDEAPKELPTRDYSTAFGAVQSESTAGSGLGAIGGVGPVAPAGPVQQASSSTTVHDFAYNMPTITHRPPEPPYPPMARAARVSGVVEVEVTIGTDGVPTNVRAISGPQQLRQHAVNYAMRWRFEPARMEGQAVQAMFRIKMTFRL
jgi:protein TonB